MKVVDAVIRLILMAGAASFLAAGWLLWRRRRYGYGVFGVTWIAVASLIVFNAAVAGHPPLGNMYHVLVFLAACLGPLFALVAWRRRMAWTGHYFAFASAIPLIGASVMSRDVVWRRMPALQSGWFVPHVTAYMLSYSLATVAFALWMVCLIRRRALDPDARERYAEGAYTVLKLAFPLMTFGMLSGALWADDAWGGYWSWDTKETWSLITWMLYAAYFHCRKDRILRPYADWAQGLAFVALLITFLLVNLLPKLSSALHSYASRVQ